MTDERAAEGVDDLRSRIGGRWPEAREVREIGKGLFLVRVVPATNGAAKAEPPSPPAEAEETPPSPQQAEALLEAARRSGEPKREAEALTDLGVILLRSGEPMRAAEALEQALSIMTGLDDRSRDAEISGQLGTALLKIGQADRALKLLEWSVLRTCREAPEYSEKLAAGPAVGLAHVSRGDPMRALASFERAVGLARALNDRGHEATLLWYSSICLAGLGRRDEATWAGAMAVERMKALGNPQSSWYADHLNRYRSDGSSGPLGGATDSPMTAPSSPAPTGPGILTMALSAGKAMATFLGSGMKTTPNDLRLARLATCEPTTTPHSSSTPPRLLHLRQGETAPRALPDRQVARSDRGDVMHVLREINVHFQRYSGPLIPRSHRLSVELASSMP